MERERLGVYGGTFNPIHTGHLIIAQEVYEQFALDRLLFIPSARPPHKHATSVIEPEHRLEMVRIAIQDDPRFEISDIELKRPGKSYTVETLRQLQQLYDSEPRLFFVIGADSLVEIDTWKAPDEVFALCSVVVVPRPGVDIKHAPLPWREQVTLVQSPEMAISSTDIRRRIQEGRRIRYLVPDGVEQYIRAHRLYRRD